MAVAVMLVCIGTVSAAETDKTLVSWVYLSNTTQRGGSALTVQCDDLFDGIVFGETNPGKWMAGSNFFCRTQKDQSANTIEQSDPKTLIQIAIVYQGDRISIFRNGKLYTSYQAQNIDLLSPINNMVVFGRRHMGSGSGQTLQGSIEDARIYDRALTTAEINLLKPKIQGKNKPFAWWTFDKGAETDRMGRFPANTLVGGAKISGGKLILETNGSAMYASDKPIEFGKPETPSMPTNRPDGWLTYHLVHPGPGIAVPGDPNCAFFWKGEYHLHYIYDHNGFNFAHISSKDLVHWQWHTTTLTPAFTGHGMFSGTGFFTKEGKPAIIYHGYGSDRNQIAFALDDKFEKWTLPYPVEPVTKDGQPANIRNWDPDCWLNGDTYYALSGGQDPELMKSKDLKSWEYIGHLLSDDYPTNLGVGRNEDISCGNMFKIGNKWMLLCISHGLGCRYYLGDFKDEKYLPVFHAMMSWNGNHFFAPESVLTKDGRRVMWAWIMNLPTTPSGVQSLPRELSLPEDGVLRIKPLRELETLRYHSKTLPDIQIKSDSIHKLEISGNTLELNLTIKPGNAAEYGVNVLTDAKGSGVPITIKPLDKTLSVGPVTAPFELKTGEDLKLRVFLDKNLVEVFANDRQAVVSAGGYEPNDIGINAFSNGGDIQITECKSWKMRSIYSGR